jgi:hypothetical protein
LGHINSKKADKREIKDFHKFAYRRTSFIRKTLYEMHLQSPAAPSLSHCGQKATRLPQPNTASHGLQVLGDAGGGLGK